MHFCKSLSEGFLSIVVEVLSAVREHDLVSPSETLVVGVSGGVDSLVLLHVLKALQQQLGIHLHAATLDHGLRGEAGAADASFVEEIAHEWGIACTRGRSDVKALAAERSIGIEHAARLARYAFLAETAREIGARRIAVAHHADDQVETVLLHLIRGAGIGGLAGMRWMAALPGHPDLRLIRPLLGVRRNDIEAYSREHAFTPREDASNADTTYTRNKIRRDVLPLLRQINAEADAAFLRLADNAAADEDYLQDLMHAAVAESARLTAGRIALPLPTFLALKSALQRRFVQWSARQVLADSLESSDEMPVSRERTLAAVHFALTGMTGAFVELGNDLRLRLEPGWLAVERADARAALPDTPLVAAGSEVTISIPFEIALGGWQLRLSREKPEGDYKVLDLPQGADIMLRTRRTGDRFRIALRGGQTGTQTLGKWMIVHQIPRDLRSQVPQILVNNQIAVILWKGLHINADFRPNPVDEPRGADLLYISLTKS